MIASNVLSAEVKADTNKSHCGSVETNRKYVIVTSFLPFLLGAYYEVFRVLWNCFAYGNSMANPIIYNYVSQVSKMINLTK